MTESERDILKLQNEVSKLRSERDDWKAQAERLEQLRKELAAMIADIQKGFEAAFPKKESQTPNIDKYVSPEDIKLK